MKTYTFEELEEWCKQAFNAGYSEGVNDGHPMAPCRGHKGAFKDSDIEYELYDEKRKTIMMPIE